MQATPHSIESTLAPLFANVLGVLAVMLVVAVLANISLPLIANDRVAFYALAAIGLTMCGVGGIGRAQATLGWLHPLTLVGISLGIVATLLIVAVLAGRTDALGPIGVAFYGDSAGLVSGERVALIALAIVMAAKWVLGFGMALFR
jgi:hypothetical protein